ncbi:Tol-Pal system beta propeller repeat protein TolB [bacterium]|nr:Tol-Pal system beta propeller repeat protein TolB [bacterium]
MKRKLFIFLVLFASFMALAQSGDAYLKISDYGSGVVRLAVPNFVPRFDNYGAEWDSTIAILSSVLRNDLRFSPFIDVIDSALYPQDNVVNPKDMDPFEWASINAHAIALGQFDTDGVRVSVKIGLYSVNSKAKLYKHDYTANAVQARRLMHRISDDIHKALTGEEGVAQTQISFISNRWGDDNKDIYICDYDGYAQRRITESLSIVLSPDWSPGGDKISYTSYKNENPDLYIYDIYKERESIIAEHPGPNITGTWSPDGRTICYSRISDANSELFLMDVRTGEESRLTFTPYSIENSPSFSPTGREIAFTSDRSGSPQVYIMDVMGTHCRRVTYEGRYNDGVDWSPKGDRLCYTSRTDQGFQIAVINVAYGDPVYVTSVGSNENPYWAPDGYHVVFSSNRTGRYQLYTMNWDGTDVRRITSRGTNTAPTWSSRYRWSFD